ncbi:secreted protein [Candidatus Thiomargarita nelsonii]|uniref:Secreted protein n=1 Tax=Candidatus Thiomargarita nelsonii TaxID=1003181 RepID=A0A176RT90_9GAMM|nr:secreted protein [Candidatus Thiomargarita nelsonii]
MGLKIEKLTMRNKRLFSATIVSGIVLINSGCASLEKSWTEKCHSICSAEFSTDSLEYKKCTAKTTNLFGSLVSRVHKCNNFVEKYQTCDGYGFSRGTSFFSSCLMQLEIADSTKRELMREIDSIDNNNF